MRGGENLRVRSKVITSGNEPPHRTTDYARRDPGRVPGASGRGRDSVRRPATRRGSPPPATIGAATVTTPPVITAPGATVAEDELLEHTLTPQAEIRLGQGKADTTLLMRRSAGRSLLYTIHSAWRGIVEYLFSPFGLFHRADVIARVYDPELLSDLERARELMATADVSPLTIAVARRRLEEQSRPVPTAPAQAPAAQPEPALPVTTAPAPAAVHHLRRSTLTSWPTSASRRNCAKRPPWPRRWSATPWPRRARSRTR